MITHWKIKPASVSQANREPEIGWYGNFEYFYCRSTRIWILYISFLFLFSFVYILFLHSKSTPMDWICYFFTFDSFPFSLTCSACAAWTSHSLPLIAEYIPRFEGWPTWVVNLGTWHFRYPIQSWLSSILCTPSIRSWQKRALVLSSWKLKIDCDKVLPKRS